MAVWLIIFQLFNDSLLFNFFNSYGVKISTILFMLMILIPLILVKIMKGYNIIESEKMVKREERQLVYTVIAALYLLNYTMLTNLNVPDALRSTVLGVMFTLIGLALINKFYKISAHMAGAGGLIGMIIHYLLDGQTGLLFLLIVIVLAGIIASSRLYLNAHNNGQLVSGLLLGIGVVFIIFQSHWLPVF